MNEATIDSLKRGDQFLVTKGIAHGLGVDKPEVHVFTGRFEECYEFAIYIGGEGVGNGSPKREDLRNEVFQFEPIGPDHPDYVKDAGQYAEGMGALLDTLDNLSKREAAGEEMSMGIILDSIESLRGSD